MGGGVTTPPALRATSPDKGRQEKRLRAISPRKGRQGERLRDT